MDKQLMDKWLTRYPKLLNFMDAGTISLKAAREILDVDRYFMYDMFKDFLTAGAVTASGSNAWRATSELKEYLKEKRIEQNANE